MSKRRRHQGRRTETSQIEWLRHRAGYPSAEEREQILRLRRQLSLEMLTLAVARAGQDDPRFRALISKYGKEEVSRAEQTLRDGLDIPSRVAGDAKSNRDYRLRYSRFGAGLPYFTARQRDDLYEKYAQQFQDESEDAHNATEADEVEKLLLMEWRNWEDLTPPAIPPRPQEYSAPPPASYPAPIDELLEWGSDLNRSHHFADEQDYMHWKRFIPALTRMALDPGLLNGWPSEAASWAPWHAIHALGNLQAWESAPALAELADLEEDWLSDHLPHIWADMGPQAEPMLWMIVEDRSASAQRRSLAAEGLYMMTDTSEAIYNKVVKGFEKILRNDRAFDPALNAHLITFLELMEALDKVRPAINEAFDQERVDLDIITPADLDEDDVEHEEQLE